MWQILGPPYPRAVCFSLFQLREKEWNISVAKSRVKADSIGPIHTAEVSLQQRFRGGRQSRNLVGVISHEISAEPWNLCGQRLQCCAEKRLRLPCVWGILVFFRSLATCEPAAFSARCGRRGPKPVLMQINSRKLPGLTQAVRLRMGKFDLQKTSKIQIENDKVVAKELLTSGIGGDVQNIRRKIPERIFNQIM